MCLPSRFRLFIAVIAVCGCIGYPQPATAQVASPFLLTDVTGDSGLGFQHCDGSSGKHYLVESVAAGLASFDYDSDGRIDVYFLNGAPLPINASPQSASHQSASHQSASSGVDNPAQPVNQLFRNRGKFQFVDVTGASGLGDAGFGLGVCVGDYNSDGFPDVYLSNYGPNGLYCNNGDGTFTAIMDQPSLECGDKVGGGCCMLDIDGDGDLDIYAASYIHMDYSIAPSYFRGRNVYGGPLLFAKQTDNLLQNQADGSFRDVTATAGIDTVTEWGMGTICFDYDQDGDTDIFVANDSTKNTLWQNDGNGKFTDVALLSGIAYDYRGDPQGSMGIDVADFDGDLWPDLFQTSYTKQLPTLYQNMQGTFFQDVTLKSGAGAGMFYAVNWGTGFADFDNDGDKDIFVANGHIHDNLDDLDDTVSYKIANKVLENQRRKKFVDVSASSGSGLLPVESSRGMVIDDFDNDGRPDIIVLNSRTKPTAIRNDSATAAHWIELNLVGIQCNRDGVGSQVLVTTTDGTQLLEVHSGRGYQSHFGSRLHFGLGSANKVERLEVRWHGQAVQVMEGLAANSFYLIREGDPPIVLKAIP